MRWLGKSPEQLMAHGALGAPARDELGILDATSARRLQAAVASAASFTLGAALPLVVAAVANPGRLMPWVASLLVAFLALLGAVAARAGGASMPIGAWRVTFWGALAMGVTAAVGALVGTAV
jgi:VIT1/CCC1 family predicted Fe2+/Mn2+ transporter